jgi:hypothetical protein
MYTGSTPPPNEIFLRNEIFPVRNDETEVYFAEISAKFRRSEMDLYCSVILPKYRRIGSRPKGIISLDLDV